MGIYSSLERRVIIVTGGARGLGRTMALALAAQGAYVLITASRKSREMDLTIETATKAGNGAMFGIVSDVTDPEACECAAAACIDAYGRIDVLVNNAARSGFDHVVPRLGGNALRFWETEISAYRTVVDTNFVGPWLMARAVLPHMMHAGFGKIINISTSRPNMVRVGGSPYGALKAGLEASSVSWANDLAGSGVTVNVLLPGGPADTALIPGIVGSREIPGFKPGKGPPGREGFVEGGLLPPQVMTAPILWLCADDSNGFNGRRVIGRDWDPDLPSPDAAAVAMQPKGGNPVIM
jgi:NAD(P)-dependent dehydrogenase (short-subunit alcohol dehydrogenase family)